MTTLTPGRYRYSFMKDQEPLEIELVEVRGQLMARFPPSELDHEGFDVPAADLAGRFEPVEGGRQVVKHVDVSDMEDCLSQIADQIESGKVTSFAVRYQDQDGTWHDVTAGYETEEEAAAALAKLHRAKGQLH